MHSSFTHCPKSFDNAVTTIRYLAQKIKSATADLNMQEVEAQFSLKLGAEGGIPLISKATGEGHITVKIVWRQSD